MAFFGAKGTTREQQLGCPALTDQSGKNRARTHVTAGKADPGEQEGAFRPIGSDTHVAGHRNDCASTHGDTVDGRDDRSAAVDHGFHHVAGHTGELE